jgi:hypothetical protein
MAGILCSEIALCVAAGIAAGRFRAKWMPVREESALKQKTRASVLIQSEPIVL